MNRSASPKPPRLDYRAVFNAASNGMAFTEFSSSRILDVNDAWIRATGIVREKAIGRAAVELGAWADLAEREACLAELERKGRLVGFEARLIMKSVALPHLISGQFVEMGGKRCVLWEFRDIAEQKRTHEALIKCEAQVKSSLAESEHSRRELLSILQDEKLAKEALRESEQRFRELTETMPDAVLVGQDGRNVYANPAAARMFLAAGPEELVGLDVFALIAPAQHEWSRQHMQRALAGEKQPLFEDRFVRCDGSLVPVKIGVSPLTWQGRPALQVILRDITERKRMEQTLRDSQELYASLVENLPQSVFRKDREGRFRFCNQRFCEGLGHSVEEILGKTDADFFPPQLAAAYRQDDLRVMESGQALDQVEEHMGADGRKLFVQVVKIPLRDASGGVIGVQGIFWDITERKRAKEALEKSESLLHATGKMARVGGWEFDVGMLKQVWTREVYEIHEVGLDYEPTVSKGIDFYAPKAKPIIAQAVQRAIDYGGLFDLELPFITAQGNHRWVHVIGQGEQSDGKTTKVFGTFQDITARKQTEQALRAVLLQLSRAEDTERRRIARELHDSTAQKLAALSMTVGLLQDDAGAPAGRPDKRFADCLAIIDECAQEIRMHSYLLHPPLLDELGLAAALSDYVEGFAKRSGVGVALDVPPGLERLPDEVEIALFRVVQEGLTNVHRHAGASTARLRLACDAEQVTLEVRDTGRGMSTKTLRRLEAGRGATGVGIAGMRERLRLLGGRLEMESGKHGTTIRAIVPRRREPT